MVQAELEELKKKLDAVFEQDKKLTSLENKIKNRETFLDNLEKDILGKEQKLANLEKDFNSQYAQRLRTLEERESASREREKETTKDSEAARIERNTLAMEKGILEGQKEEAIRTLKEYGERSAKIKSLIEELSKTI